jgi:DMSO/TMAO reductase YedYZ molybdopterin-dependent catalytic subunit
MNERESARRRFFARTIGAAGALLLGGCQRLSESAWFPKVLGTGEAVSEAFADLVTPKMALAQEFTEADRSPTFRSNGTAMPATDTYRALLAGAFADYRLEIGGLVATPMRLSLADVQALPSRTQITRHDCVEGWSCIGKWKGVQLSALLDRARLKPNARYIVFYCADNLFATGDDKDKYYESIGLEDAYHPQTILAYEMNDQTLPIAHGAPLRLRVERQLGYKMAKYVMRVEAVDDLAKTSGGRGGFWEDLGYEWYDGI